MYATEAERGSRGIAPLILYLGTLGKSPRYSLNRRLGEPQGRSGHFGEQ